MKTIRLYGFLGEQFGTHHMRDVADGAEALRAMSATVPGFEEALIQEQTYGFQIFYDEELTTEHIKNPTNCEVIKIVPVLLAAKGWYITGACGRRVDGCRLLYFRPG